MVVPANSTPVKSRTAAHGAWLVCALTLLVTAGSVVLTLLNTGDMQETLFAVVIAACALVGGLVASRRPANVVGWCFLGSAACFAGVAFATQYALYGLVTMPGALPLAWLMAWVSAWLSVPGPLLLFTLMPLYFPNGRLLSSGWRWLVRFVLCFSVAIAIFWAFAPGEIRNLGLVNPLGIEALPPTGGLLDTILLIIYLATIGAAAASLITRFRRSHGEERQQIKWLAYAAAVIPVWFLTNWWIQAINPVVFAVMDALIISGLPVTAAIAILKYRLYDIDVIINRTLVYGTLTVLLAVIYFGDVIVLREIFAPIIGWNNQVAIVASTLAIAALFSPLRRRIQSVIDRRFYRHKYDAQKTLQAFSARLRDETDLSSLSRDTLQVVQETLQPAHVSMWLREPVREQRGAGQRRNDHL